MPNPVPRHLNTLLAAPLLVLGLAAPSAAPGLQAPEAAGGSIDSAIGRCMELRTTQPRQAIELATALAARPGLERLQRIKIQACNGVAAALTGQVQQAAGMAEAIERELQDGTGLEPADRMRALSQVGRILHSIGQIYRAEEAYGRAVEVAQRQGGGDAVLVQASTLNNIGLIHADYLDAADEAERYFRQAIALYETAGENPATALANLGMNLQRQGEFAQALQVLQRAAGLASGSGNEIVRLRALSAVAELEPGLDLQARLQRLDGLRQVQAGVPDPVGEGLSLARMAMLQVQAGAAAQALELARRSLELTRPSGSPNDIYASLDALVAAHAALGNTRLALQQAEFKHSLKQQYLRRQRLEMLAGLQARNQDAASQRELERLRYEEQIRRLEEQEARTLRNATMLTLLVLLAASLVFALLQRRDRAQLQRLSEIDALTGLANRHAATAALNALATQRCQGQARHVLFLIDVDHFKQINDGHGHHTGDQVLAGVGARLRQACRAQDLVARWGGEEFLVACPDLERDQAAAMAARLHQAMGFTLDTAAGPRAVTASLGLAPIPFFDDAPEHHAARRWDYALRMADRALYAAKERRDAWVGYWGARLPEDEAAAEAVLECPEAAPQVVEVMSSFPRDIDRVRQESLRALACLA